MRNARLTRTYHRPAARPARERSAVAAPGSISLAYGMARLPQLTKRERGRDHEYHGSEEQPRWFARCERVPHEQRHQHQAHHERQ